MSSIIDQLESHIQARKSSVIALREHIATLLAPIPVGVVLSDDAGEVCRVVKICTGASQWSNRRWEVTIYGRGYLTASGLLLAKKIDESHHDGHNLHTRSNEAFCTVRRGEADRELDFTAGAETRTIATRLPVAVARYMEHCQAEAAANAATLVG